MQRRLIELHLERGRLLERIGNQRQVLAVQAAPLARTLQIGDRIHDWLAQGKQFALDHPVVVGASVLTVVVLRPGGVLRWSRRGLIAWRTWTALRAVLPAYLAGPR